MNFFIYLETIFSNWLARLKRGLWSHVRSADANSSGIARPIFSDTCASIRTRSTFKPIILARLVRLLSYYSGRLYAPTQSAARPSDNLRPSKTTQTSSELRYLSYLNTDWQFAIRVSLVKGIRVLLAHSASWISSTNQLSIVMFVRSTILNMCMRAQ